MLASGASDIKNETLEGMNLKKYLQEQTWWWQYYKLNPLACKVTGFHLWTGHGAFDGSYLNLQTLTCLLYKTWQKAIK